MNSGEPTRKYLEFEKVAINPEAYSTDELLTALRAGNIAVGRAYRNKMAEKTPIRDWNGALDLIGDVLAKRWGSEGAPNQTK